MGDRDCLHCGGDIVGRSPKAKFCSARCKGQHDQLVIKYGITNVERKQMYADQEGKCKVCDTHMTWEHRKPNMAVVDHCHTTGEVHGLLCSNCNRAIGMLGESPVILAKAIQYLTETGKVPTR